MDAVPQLTLEEAAAVVRKLARGDEQLFRTAHFNQRLRERDYDILDVNYLLKHASIESTPAWDAEHEHHRLQLHGVTAEGRETRLVLGLRHLGDSIAVTIIDIRGRKG